MPSDQRSRRTLFGGLLAGSSAWFAGPKLKVLAESTSTHTVAAIQLTTLPDLATTSSGATILYNASGLPTGLVINPCYGVSAGSTGFAGTV